MRPEAVVQVKPDIGLSKAGIQTTTLQTKEEHLYYKERMPED